MNYEINETEAQEFLKKFPKMPREFYKERMANDTVDLKLDNLESFFYVNPKKYPTNKIYWNEKLDVQLYWKHKESLISLMILIAFLVMGFFFFSYYYLIGI